MTVDLGFGKIIFCTEQMCFSSIRSAMKQALSLIVAFCCAPSKSERYMSSNTLKVGVWELGGGSGFVSRSRVSGVDGGFVTGDHAPVPAAVAFFLLDAGVVPGLVAGIAEVGQHVRP